MLPMLFLTLCTLLEDPPVVDGRKLAAVPGPITPPGPDPSAGFGNSSFEMGIRSSSRHSGSVPAVAVPALPVTIEDKVTLVAGWKAYRVSAPAGSTVKARLRADHEAWFLVRTVNRWGTLEKGMLQNRIPTGNPEASFINPRNEPTTFYFLVDTSATLGEQEPFRLELTLK
jgi:hypothetical protein